MRSLLLAMLSMSCACACDLSQRMADSRAPVAPVAARSEAPIATAAVTPRELSSAALAAAAPVAAAQAAPAASENAPAVAAVDPRETTRRAAHDVLAEHCGECHEGHRPTAKPKALAVFDLDQPDWPSRFDDHKYQSALKRLAGKSDAARDAFIAFHDAEVAASSSSKLN